jgi:hypothetical protein
MKNHKIIIVIVAVFVCVGIVKNPLIKTVVTVATSQVMGAPVHLDSFSLGVFKQSVRIKGFKIYNPKGFPKEVLLNIVEVNVDYDLPALFKGKLHLPLIVLNLEEMTVIKNKENMLNVDALKVAENKEESAKQAAPEKKSEAKKPTQALPMQIDLASLTIGKVVFKDYSQGEQPIVQVYNVGIKNKTYKDITSAQQFAALIMVEAMGPTAIEDAALYGAATVLGVAFLPVGVAGVLIGKDSGFADFNTDYENAYQIALETVKQMGKLSREDMAKGIIKADIDGSGVTIEVKKIEDTKTKITASARKLMLPKSEIAEGVIYEISKKLK